MRHRARTGLLVAAAAFILLAAASSASAATVRVDADGVAGWAFNPDPATSTPYAFSIDEQSIGAGSLHVPPITNTGGTPGRLDKFIAGRELGILVSDLSSLSYDFFVDSAGATDYKQFYLNVYTTLPTSDPSTFYDCRFDYVPAAGAAGSFTTMTVTPDQPRTGGAGAGCPATLDGMPAGSRIRAIALNVGDTSLNDTGVSGYLDNVVIATGSGSTTYDFEATPEDKNDCKKGGYAAYGFSNQGQCVSRSNALSK